MVVALFAFIALLDILLIRSGGLMLGSIPVLIVMLVAGVGSLRRIELLEGATTFIIVQSLFTPNSDVLLQVSLGFVAVGIVLYVHPWLQRIMIKGSFAGKFIRVSGVVLLTVAVQTFMAFGVQMDQLAIGPMLLSSLVQVLYGVLVVLLLTAAVGTNSQSELQYE